MLPVVSPVTATPGQARSLYRSQRNADGTWDVFDVEVFAETVKKIGKNQVYFGRAWLEKALENARRQQSETGYIPPLKVWHKEVFVQPRFAGHFMLTRIGTMTLYGKQRPVVYADLKGVPDEVYRQVAAGRLPYRSIEAEDYLECKIDALALLDSEPPHIPFPLLRVAPPSDSSLSQDSTNRAAAFSKVLLRDGPALSCHSQGRHRVAFARFPMSDEIKDDDKAAEGSNESTEDPGAGSPAKPAEGGDVEGIVGALMKSDALKSALEGLVKNFLASIGGGAAAGGPAPAPAEPTAVQAGKGGTIDAAALATMRGEIDGLKATIAAQKNEENIKREVAACLGRLKGYNIGTDAEDRLLKMARGEGGMVALKSYEDAVKRHGTRLPPNGLAADDNAAPEDGGASVPAELAKYAGTAHFSKAAAASKEYDALRALGRLKDVSRETHLRLATEGITGFVGAKSA